MFFNRTQATTARTHTQFTLVYTTLIVVLLGPSFNVFSLVFTQQQLKGNSTRSLWCASIRVLNSFFLVQFFFSKIYVYISTDESARNRLRRIEERKSFFFSRTWTKKNTVRRAVCETDRQIGSNQHFRINRWSFLLGSEIACSADIFNFHSCCAVFYYNYL